MNIPNRAGGFLLAGALVMLVFIVFVVRRDNADDDALAAALSHTDAINDTARDSLSALKDAETGQRGYLITGKEAYLGPYNEGLKDYSANIAQLRKLTRDNRDIAEPVERMDSLAKHKREEMAETIRLFQTRGQAAAVAKVSSGIGKQYMDEIRSINLRIVKAEESAYARTRAAAARAESATRFKEVTSAAVLFLMTLLGTVLLRLEIRSGRRLTARLEASETKYRELAGSLEDLVESRTRDVQQINRELMAFSYSVSHDLRAPLRAIDGFSRILLEDYSERLDDAGRHLLQRICAGAQRMGQLIQSLLDLARLTQTDLVRERVSISELAAAAIQTLRGAHPERDVTVVIAPDLDTEADPRLLRVVIDNLLANAWKFTSKTPDAHIEVGRREADGQTVFFVRDNGSGFDPAYEERLFAPFQRLHAESEFEGTGIGLATVQRVIHRHGGHIRAHGSPGEGAEFFFALS